MQEPSVSWRRQRGADGEIDVLVLRFDQGVELHIVGVLGLRIAHWETRAEVDPEAQRAEVARALEWGRAHAAELRERFRKSSGGHTLGGRRTSLREGRAHDIDSARRRAVLRGRPYIQIRRQLARPHSIDGAPRPMNAKVFSLVALSIVLAGFSGAPTDDREPDARSGCCSHHKGVCGCENDRAKCCDGQLSPTCGCD
jgi:hypothetical protein